MGRGTRRDAVIIATVPRYPASWQAAAGRGTALVPQWIGWQRIQSAVHPGDKVFLLCNFVQERRLGQPFGEQVAKCTHGAVVHAVCEAVLAALGDSGEVCYGNAALQSSNWDRLMRETGAGFLEEHYRRKGRTVRQKDLRMVRRPRSFAGADRAAETLDAERHCVDVDLRQDSLLHELCSAGSPQFRVADYDYRRTEACQNEVEHRYMVSRDLLDADVVVHIPKLKTHEKVGITCALKGVVGIVGSKDCLAHYRSGGDVHGGDEYPGRGTWRRWQSRLHQGLHAERREGRGRQAGLMLDRNLARLLSRCGLVYGGAWHGNDTCWRMALDLARIVRYADRRGRMQDAPQRTNICLVDGIVGGEGPGPLSPKPVSSQVLMFADDLALCDLAAAKLMGFDPDRLPLVRHAFDRTMRYRVTGADAGESRCRYDDADLGVDEIRPVLGRPFEPSPGWRHHLLG